MEGPHNLQTWTGFDAIPDKDQPETTVWPEPWEGEMGAIFAMTTSVFYPEKGFNLDAARWYRETMQWRTYGNTPYFDLWLRSVSTYFSLSGLVTRADLTEGYPPPDYPQPGTSTSVAIIDKDSLDLAAQLRGQALTQAVPGFGKPQTDGRYSSPSYQEGTAVNHPLFAIGDRVETLLQIGTGHTREYPVYRGRPGVVVASYGIVAAQFTGEGPSRIRVFQPYYQPGYPDIASRASPVDGAPRQEFFVPVYSIRFEARDLWGDGYAEEGVAVYVDMFEPYLKRAAG
ncbi:SH3-like domain-containing protein [uncultured Thiodictyon sp.]|jgi:hypothetical protein|uniref:SH3-like domain-containing protein n=1 Tax=uncultured Thiodictyon sp. TaxID=1846217 RepID=UPI0025F2F8F0|nr:SH3-like domain-containing protein [uncultured Thiodictyon sp.]